LEGAQQAPVRLVRGVLDDKPLQVVAGQGLRLT
jgi:hypothetical protein